MTLADRLRANATLLSMMVEGETRLSRDDLRGLVDDLRRQATEADRLAGTRNRGHEVAYRVRKAA